MNKKQQPRITRAALDRLLTMPERDLRSAAQRAAESVRRMRRIKVKQQSRSDEKQ